MLLLRHRRGWTRGGRTKLSSIALATAHAMLVALAGVLEVAAVAKRAAGRLL